MNYSEKLKDPRWQKKRLEIFERDNWQCQGCKTTKDTLTVHHKFYKHGNDPWDYELDALITLCESCHEIEYVVRPKAEQELLLLLKRYGYSVDGVILLAQEILAKGKQEWLFKYIPNNIPK